MISLVTSSLLASSLTAPLAAHDIALGTALDVLEAAASSSETEFEPDEGRLVIDILTPPQPTPGEAVAYEACIAEQDAARLRGEIIVCRRAQDAADVSGFDKAKWEREYAQRTQGVKTPDVAGAGGTPVYRALGSMVMVNVTVSLGKEFEPPLIIDVEALPEAPPGSDADRVARGLAPLSGD